MCHCCVQTTIPVENWRWKKYHTRCRYWFQIILALTYVFGVFLLFRTYVSSNLPEMFIQNVVLNLINENSRFHALLIWNTNRIWLIECFLRINRPFHRNVQFERNNFVWIIGRKTFYDVVNLFTGKIQIKLVRLLKLYVKCLLKNCCFMVE